MMDFDGFDQTQVIPLDDLSDDTDDLGDPDDKQPVGYLKVFSQKSFIETSFPLYEGDNFIGRHESNEICIPLKALSKKHACIEIQGESHLIYDLESRNKTRRGKLFLKPSVRYELHDPDALTFGDVRCQYFRADIQKKPAMLDNDVGNDADSGSETGSESVLVDTMAMQETLAVAKEPDLDSSSSYDILQPTQPFKNAEVTNTIMLETPQREGATLIFAESSDENIPTDPVKAVTDPLDSTDSVAETPGSNSKPLAESTVINESTIDESGLSRCDLDASALANAPTQAYCQLAELETQAYPANTDSDQDDDDDNVGGRSVYDALTQAFSVADSEDEIQQKCSKKISLEPTLVLNLSTDDETSPMKRPARPKPFVEPKERPRVSTDFNDDSQTLGYPDLATQAYGSGMDHQSDEEGDDANHKMPPVDEEPRGNAIEDEEDVSTFAFPDLATQAYCADTDDQSDQEDSHTSHLKKPQTVDPTLQYNMQAGSLGTRPEQAELETQAYCAETDSDTDEKKRGGAEPTLNYEMGVVGDSDDTETQGDMGVALEPTLAYATEEDDEEEMDISALAGAATQAYTSADSDTEEVQVQSSHSEEAPRDVPGDDQGAKDQADTIPSSAGDASTENAARIDEDEVAMDTEMSLNDEEMKTDPASRIQESDARSCLESHASKDYIMEDEDDTIAATQAYGMDHQDDDRLQDDADIPTIPGLDHSILATSENVTEAAATSLVEVIDERKKQVEADDMDDFIMATQAYGADENSETQVPDSQEGREEEDSPLAGISRISSMLRRAPVRSAMASPEKKQPQRTLKVAFKDVTPQKEDASADINPPSRRSVRGRKVPARFQETQVTTVLTETDAKPTRSKDLHLRPPPDEEPLKTRMPSKSKRKGSQEVVVDKEKAVDEGSTESNVELKEVEYMTWRTVGGFEVLEVNNNNNESGIKGKPPARRTSRRQASYKKAIEGHESDDTESLSSTSSLQVEAQEIVGAAVKVEVTVCDGKKTEDEVKPRRGRRSNATKVEKSKTSGRPSTSTKKPLEEDVEPTVEETGPASASSGRRQSKRTAVTTNDVAGPAQNSKTRAGRGQTGSRLDLIVPESEEHDCPNSRMTKSSQSVSSAAEKQNPVSVSDTAKETPTSGRRGRKPKSAPTPQTKGPKQSSIMDFTLVEDKGRPKSQPEEGNAKSRIQHSQPTDSQQSTESNSLLTSEATPSETVGRTSRAKTNPSKTKEDIDSPQSAKQETFIAPEPVKRGGRGRRAVKENDAGSISEQASSEMQQQVNKESQAKKECIPQVTGRKKGRNSSKLETPQKEQQENVATPSSSRRGKRAAPSLTSPSPAKKAKESETPDGTVTSPSLRKRPSEIKPKVMFTGVVNKAWEKIVVSLVGELAQSVFDCTHLVTDKVRRTVKFLCCLSKGALIVNPKWLNQCQLNKVFVDPSQYLLHDKASEKQYGFSHVTSHQRATEGRVLASLSIHVTPNVKPEPLQMKEIILCAGGKYLGTMPRKPDSSVIIVSCESDETRCQTAIKAGMQIVSAEFILTGMLRQEARPDLYQLFGSPVTAGSGNKRRSTDAQSSSKQRR